MDSPDLIMLTADPIAPSAAWDHLTRVGAGTSGGVCAFAGCTRAETHADHGALAALAYEAYGEMAQREMERLAADAKARWLLSAVVLIHRVGTVPVGDCSVVTAAAGGHREEAFAACRWLIDTLKRDVPIWKKEIWASGAGTWVDPTAGNQRS
jgi:molybdopterin synthase catalytic subunit